MGVRRTTAAFVGGVAQSSWPAGGADSAQAGQRPDPIPLYDRVAELIRAGPLEIRLAESLVIVRGQVLTLSVHELSFIWKRVGVEASSP